MKTKYFLLGALMLLLVLALAACTQPEAPAPEAEPCPTAAPCPDCPACPEPEAPPPPVVEVVPYQDAWAGSPHNDTEAEAFNHWNEEDPAEVPTNCANCHTSAGYMEYAATGAVANPIPAPAGTIQCETCHNDATAAMTSVKFPQTYVPEEGGDPVNVVLTGLGPEARCMVCHQGRASQSTVDASIARFGEDLDPDAVPAPIKNEAGDDVNLGFVNIHYYPAGATLYGTEVKGGYEYTDKAYDPKFRHVEDLETCIGCHDQHSLEVRVEKCAECHEGVAAVEDLRNVRMNGSLADYDGDGDVEESIDSELKGMQEALYAALQEYAASVAGTGIVYDPAAYPYFFADADGDGTPDPNAEGNPTGYSTWTPRLLKAAYNYQMSVKDPGAFAHNAKYMIELMYDSIEDLNAKLGTIDMSMMTRTDAGHFAGSTEPFRHWDEEGEVPYDCVKCHTAEGLPMFLHTGGVQVVSSTGAVVTAGVTSLDPSNGFRCSTCHDGANWPAVYEVASVVFPSGARVSLGGKDADGNFVADASNLCIECHQGRSSTVQVDKALAGKDPETPDPKIRFTNIHYFAAGATLFGNDVQGAYQYEGKEYVGQNVTHPINKCADCHEVHALELKAETCTTCHTGAESPEAIRMDTTDWDGDGDVTEGVKAEIDAFAERLYAAIQADAKEKGTPILYNAAAYPYFFVDANEDGEADKNENGGSIGYNAFTPNLLKAAYNYQYVQKDPGAFTHNPKYVLQFLYDSIEDLGGDLTGLTRPEVPAE